MADSVYPKTLKNQSTVNEFIFVGITSDQNLSHFLFILFLLIYLITVLGNTTILLSILIIKRLHTPMYFFLSNLSFSDFCLCSTVTPNMLHDFFSDRKVITFIGCLLQLYFFATFATMESYILSVMAYDRFVAICHPLVYVVIMNKKVCAILMSVMYSGGFVTAGIHTICTFSSTFCGPNIINHFYCDIPPLKELACSDTYVNQTIIFGISAGLGLVSVSITLGSYVYIFYTIMNMQSLEGRYKAFSTCTSHLLCVSLFYGTVFFMYLRPASNYSITHGKVVSIFYTMVIPMMNPIIYTLRNRDIRVSVGLFINKLSLL
ncbi:olfactory receptor 5AR1-like [Hyperolius riggenbachi]|uniref:olfactory receptor 5AR1-like n=1 Tax=Hyperolius riggenbachi TaxID=752182 RepID=UPI0035A3B975